MKLNPVLITLFIILALVLALKAAAEESSDEYTRGMQASAAWFANTCNSNELILIGITNPKTGEKYLILCTTAPADAEPDKDEQEGRNYD